MFRSSIIDFLSEMLESLRIVQLILEDVLAAVIGHSPDEHSPRGQMASPHLQSSSSDEASDGGGEPLTQGSNDSGVNVSGYPGTDGETPGTPDSGVEERLGTPRALFDPTQPGKYGGLDL